MIESKRLSKRELIKNVREDLFSQINKLVKEAEAELETINQK